MWPAAGFNCFRWTPSATGKRSTCSTATRRCSPADGRPAAASGAVPFPQLRIRDGQFEWAGTRYQHRPTTRPARTPSTASPAADRGVLDQGASDAGAHVTGVFRCSVDDPASVGLWPADHEIRLTVRLGRGTLRLEAEVFNPDEVPLPFGLGYHPYFRLPFNPSVHVSGCTVEVPAARVWELRDNLPTGPHQPVDARRDLNRPRPFTELQVDDVLTDLPSRAARADGLIERATIKGSAGRPVRLFCDPAFREMVVFTPPHRQAFCAEPYTCVTDAINLHPAGLDTGWQELAPGETWTATIELWV
ncbi:MAG: hypothetical protein U0736_23765 [Gemmataceae bacterium]